MAQQQIAEVVLQVEAIVRNRHGTLAGLTVGVPHELDAPSVLELLTQRLARAGLTGVHIENAPGSNPNIELVSLEFRW